MKLKGRLKAVADKVDFCEIVCDIGTDHAYIPIYLINKGICKIAIASDVRKGPLLIAEENIRQYGLNQRIEARLGSGLENIKENEVDTVIIAGMGGMLIRDILARDSDKARKAGKLILQPMNSIDVVRQWLYSNGFDITDEELINEGVKTYNIITARWTGCIRILDEIYFHIGRRLIEKKDPLLKGYILKKIKLLKNITDEIRIGGSENTSVLEYYESMESKLDKILKQL